MSLPPEIVVEVYFPPFTSGVTVVEQPMEVTVARTIPSAAGPVVWGAISDIPPAIDAIDGLVPAPDRVPYYTGATSAALTPLTAFGRSLIDDTDAAAARATLGAAAATHGHAIADVSGLQAALDGKAPVSHTHDIGSGTTGALPLSRLDQGGAAAGQVLKWNGTAWVPAADDTGGSPSWSSISNIPPAIDAIDHLTPAADRIAYYTGADTAALTPLTAFGRSLIDDADAAAGRTTLGAQRAIQFQDGGSNLGTAGTVSTVNFTGSGVTASRSGDTITVNVTGGGGGGASTFLDLSDTPGSYTDAAGNYVRVNSTPDGLEFRTAAQVRSDIGAAAASHTHSAADITAGTLAVGRGGTGISSYTAGNYIRAADASSLEQRTPAQVRSDIGAAAASHTHSAADITTGTLVASRGGTGLSSYTAGNYIRAASSSSLEQRTPAQVLGDIGAAAASHTHTVSEVSGAVPDTRTINTTNGITGGGNLTANRTFELTGQALALHNLATNGLIARTGSGTVAARTIEAGANISVTNGDGVAGNPTIDVVGLAAVATSGSASDLTSGILAVARGGTGANTAAGARANLDAAAASHTHAPGDIDGITGPAVIGRVPNTSGPASAISPAHSVVLDTTGLRLVNDTASPGGSKYYGTNASGTRGWYDLPSGGGGGGGGTAGIEPWRWFVAQALVDSGTDIYTLLGERLVEVQMRPFHGHAATNSSSSGTGAGVVTVGNGAPTWLQNSNGPHRAPARVSTGTTATGSAIFYAFPLTSERVDVVPFSSARPFCWGDIAVDTLSTSAERFHVRAGFAMSPLFSDHAANVQTTFSLYYRDDVNGGRWAIMWRTIDTTGAQTLVDTGITVAAATRVLFCFVAISDNQVRAWVRQGSSEYRDTITVSSSPVMNTIWAASIVKSVGTTARFLWVRDYGSGVWYPS